MGNLAERYCDSSRSGLYRVTCPEVPLRAALEADAKVVECSAELLEVRWLAMKYSLEHVDRIRVLIVHNAGELASPNVRQWGVLSKLLTIAKVAREQSSPFFAVFVDAHHQLLFPDLWKERLHLRRESVAENTITEI